MLNKLLLNNSSKTFSFDVITVDSYGKIINQENKSAKYQTLDLGNGVDLELVSIPGGEFLMGSPQSEVGSDENEGPQHKVTVPGFWMGKYPVTQVQWGAIMGTNPSKFLWEKRPVERVRWDDCIEVCQKLSQINKLYTTHNHKNLLLLLLLGRTDYTTILEYHQGLFLHL